MGEVFAPSAPALRPTAADELSIRRRRCGRGFVYLDADGGVVRDASALRRIRALAIPPAYAEVRIAAAPDAHLQAVGRDEAGRLQYRYHPGWQQVREAAKVERLAALVTALPRLRGRVRRVLRQPGEDRRTATAAAVLLIDRTHIRVGHADYVHSGRSRGAATLLKRQVVCDGDLIRLSFHGKRRQPIVCELRAPALARAVEALAQLPGRRLFQYRDSRGRVRHLAAADINAFLHAVAEAPVTAKDFRTLAATAAAGERLAALEPDPRAARRRRQLAETMREVAAMLHNTPTVTRKSYVHGDLVAAFESGRLRRLAAACRPRRGLTHGEALVAALFAED